VRFGALPGALDEAASVTQAWTAAGAGAVDQLTGDRASETEFKRLAPGRSVIHLATHGFVLGDACRGEGRQSLDLLLDTSAAEEPVENPLLRSGLALAGANARVAGSGADDGILTADEVAALDLQGVDWAVLSACNTGIGRLQDGEGVMGLRRAFQVAGVKTLIISLWPVDDDSTKELMTTLYQQRFGQRQDVAGALRVAGLQLLERRRAVGQSTHPFFWGPFVAAGSWN
jgi:CHAT domain-containing protein